MADLILFVVLPYAAAATAAAAGAYRYFFDRYSYSSFSSQFFESRRLFLGSIPMHYALGAVLVAHLFAVLFPAWWKALLGPAARLIVLEVMGLGLGAAATWGAAVLVGRRLSDPRLRVVTTFMDWVVGLDLLFQVVSGLYVAAAYRWGGAWFLQTAAPWLRSLAFFAPDIASVSALPLAAKLHIANAWVLVALLPFSRLVHLLAVPVGFLFRPYQVVIWERR